ncbi:MAG: hypothetical protein ACLFVB_10575, partial [Thermoplasmata archaeon]
KRDPTGLVAEPTMIDGSPSATPCPDSSNWESYEACVRFERETFGEPSAKEICADICFGESEFHEDAFWSCLGEDPVGSGIASVGCIISVYSGNLPGILVSCVAWAGWKLTSCYAEATW